MAFLRTVQPENLRQLRTFKTDGYEAGVEREQQEVNVLLRRLLLRIESLDKLSIRTSCPNKKLRKAVKKHQFSLRELDIREFPSRPYSLSVQQLGSITNSHLNLTDVTVDLCLDDCCDCLKAWCEHLVAHRNLRRLTIYIAKHCVSSEAASVLGWPHEDAADTTQSKEKPNPGTEGASIACGRDVSRCT